MATVFMHCPLNISRTLAKMMEEFCVELQKEHGISVRLETQPHRPEDESMFKKYLDEGGLPDLTLGHVNDFAELPEGYLAEHCRPLPGRFPLRKELADLGFADDKGYFNPFVVIPFAAFYNREQVSESEVPRTWKELCGERWRNRIIMPDDFRMVSVIVRAFMAADYADEFKGFMENVTFQGSPLEAVNAVDEGRYHIGITNIAFARISSQKNIRIIWPKDGMFCMPMIMAWSKKAPEPLLKIGDFLLSATVQEYFALQSFVPVSPETPLPQLVAENNCNLRWKGWDSFLKVVKERHD